MTIDPNSLPQIPVRQYDSVDTSNYAAGNNMDREQLLFMASLASDRGEADHAQEWRMMALRHAQAEEISYQREQIDKMMAPKATVPPGTQLVEKQDDSPWMQDPEFVTLADQAQTAEEVVADTPRNHPAFSERTVDLGRLRQQRDDRAREVREQALQSGAWSETEEAQRGAQASLDEKAGRIARSMRMGGTS